MDSLKVPKGKSSSSITSGLPISIRFNAGEESIESGTVSGRAPSESLSNSPQQTDDISWHKEFLQSSFFGRKRSGSIEEKLSQSSFSSNGSKENDKINLIGNNVNTGKTWKLIKGKVTQAMEDIKSSKAQDIINKTDDSDIESGPLNSSMSDDITNSSMRNITDSDSDFDIDSDLTMPADNSPPSMKSHLSTSLGSNSSSNSGGGGSIIGGKSSILKKSLANLKNSNTSDLNYCNTTSSSTSIIEKTFLRRRKKSPIVSNKPIAIKENGGSGSGNNGDGKSLRKINENAHIEIESAVEMCEDMNMHSVDDEFKDAIEDKTVNNGNGGDGVGGTSLPGSPAKKFTDITNLLIEPGIPLPTTTIEPPNDTVPPTMYEHLTSFKSWLRLIYNFHILFIGLLLIIVFYSLNIPQFLQGVFTCLYCFLLFNQLYEFLQNLINAILLNNEGGSCGSTIIGYLLHRHSNRKNSISNDTNCDINNIYGGGHGVEKGKFTIPDYTKITVCEIQPIDEFKVVKSYTGWMNEINNYDPSSFHISMTRSVYIKLDGTTLHIYNTNSRIPKRSMWNEKKIEKKDVQFTKHSIYNLLECRIEMCPRGLARKRHFSRKYPIQLTIKSTTSGTCLDRTNNDDKENGITKSDENIINSSGDRTGGDQSKEPHRMDSENSDTNENMFDIDIGATIMNSEMTVLQRISETQELNKNAKSNVVPCGDDSRILLFARNDREKEDWYRRFLAASKGLVNDQEPPNSSDFVTLTDEEMFAYFENNDSSSGKEENVTIQQNGSATSQKKDDSSNDEKSKDNSPNKLRTSSNSEETKRENLKESIFKGLLMTTGSSRGPTDYIKFMSRYQKACLNLKIPVVKNISTNLKSKRKQRREKKTEDDLWKGIDQSLYLGPSGSIVWANVLFGRILYSCLNDTSILKFLQDFLEKKLSAIRLPSFMEDVHVAEIKLGDTPPIIHRISQPVLDERGVWIDSDITYEGLLHMTITTKLNLMRLRKQYQTQATGSSESTVPLPNELAMKIICDSDAESSGASSSDSESSTQTNSDCNTTEQQAFYSPPGGSRKIFRIVDRIAASNLFQSATEISYIQRAMENMSTNIKLRVELKGLVARVIINLPPPPSDRLWIGFRGPPRLWLTAKPAVGDHTFDWSIVTNVIESKLCDEVYKYLVYPNMVDIILPFLGQPTYNTTKDE